MAETVKNPPEKQVTWVQSLDGEDPLEKGMATHSSILPWRIPWTEEPNVLQSMGWQRVRHDWVTNTQPSLPTWSRSRWRLWKSGLTLFKVSLIAKVFAGLESWLVSWCPPEVGRECFTGQRMQQSSPSGPDGPNHRRCLYQCTAAFTNAQRSPAAGLSSGESSKEIPPFLLLSGTVYHHKGEAERLEYWVLPLDPSDSTPTVLHWSSLFSCLIPHT